MSEKRFVCIDIGYGDDWYITDNGIRLSEMEIVDALNSQSEALLCYDKLVSDLRKENEQLKAKVKRLQDIATRTEEEKEEFADLYNECRRLKLSDEAIKQAYADLNRKEREKHSQGNATYTDTINQNEVIY